MTEAGFYEDAGLHTDSSPVLPQRLVRILQETMPADTVYALDAGEQPDVDGAPVPVAAGAHVLLPGRHGGHGLGAAGVGGAPDRLSRATRWCP